MKNKLLRNGVEMPEVGFGTWKAGETDGFAVLSEAIRAGYRHIDTASAYHTEEAVGRAVAASGVDRSEFFITTKAWKDQLGYDRTLAAFDASCQALGMDYLDLYLIHWPRPDAACEEWKELDRGSWRAMEELYRAGRVRAIGVSNFLPHHLENLLEVCTVPPMVDQIEFHPGYVQWETVEFCRASQILVEAWSPLGRQRLADDPLLAELAGKYGVFQAQICLRFALDCGVVPLPKSADAGRMRQNLALDVLARELGRIGLVHVLAGAARPGMGAGGRPCAGARGAVPRAAGTVGGVRVLQPFRHFRTRLSSSRKATL